MTIIGVVGGVCLLMQINEKIKFIFTVNVDEKLFNKMVNYQKSENVCV